MRYSTMAKSYVLTGKDVATKLTIEHKSDGSWLVTGDEGTADVDVRQIAADRFLVVANHKNYIIRTTKGPKGTELTCANQTVRLELVDALRYELAASSNAAGGKTASGGEVFAPIAGRIVKIAVAVGDIVEEGQSVIILEAMKMENEIKSEYAGRVEALKVNVGDSVETDQLMLVLVAN